MNIIKNTGESFSPVKNLEKIMNKAIDTKNWELSGDINSVAETETVTGDFIREHLTSGEIVILRNRKRKITPVAVGKNMRTKVNANIGSSPDLFNMEHELKKLEAAVNAGADTVMDLSTGGDIREFRRQITEASKIPLGTVPLYEAAVEMRKQKKSIMEMTIDDFLKIVSIQAEEGVDFMTIHSGITRNSYNSLKSEERIAGIVSRGGSILAEWMKLNKSENPLYSHYDEILDILAEYNVVISLGDSLRPGSIHDANDRGQVHELIILGELAQRASEKGVQAMIEGPGHVQLDMIEENIKLQKSVCGGAPYYVLGPLVTDVAPGYDHITSAIGGALAASKGADFLCYVTPAEHLRLPDTEDVREGVIASRIAAHAADMVKLGSRARKWDREMSLARKNLDWEEMFRLSIDEVKARKYRSELPSGANDQCSMCGEYCAVKRDI
jgi:phosphomethylpyrimidine synthase